MSFFDYFQITIVATVLLIIAVKASYLFFARNIVPIVVARSGNALSRVIEAMAFFGLLFWLVLIVSYAVHRALRSFRRRYTTNCSTRPRQRLPASDW